MTYVVNDGCIRCKTMDCVDVCPVDCFYEGENMLVIHPDECIDCGVCEPECPVDAIKPDTEPGLEKWLSLNAEYAKIWPNIAVKKSPRRTGRSGKGSQTNFNTSHHIPAREIEAARAVWVPDPRQATDPTGRCPRRGSLKAIVPRLTRRTSHMTEALANKTCTPCRGGIPPLTHEQAELFHAQAPDWQLAADAHRLERGFRFRNFREALTFVQEIGELAEAEGHHPNICFGWGNATVSLQTKKIKGLHENDFIMATKIDRIFARAAAG